jgi:hypothetical protein
MIYSRSYYTGCRNMPVTCKERATDYRVSTGLVLDGTVVENDGIMKTPLQLPQANQHHFVAEEQNALIWMYLVYF